MQQDYSGAGMPSCPVQPWGIDTLGVDFSPKRFLFQWSISFLPKPGGVEPSWRNLSQLYGLLAHRGRAPSSGQEGGRLPLQSFLMPSWVVAILYSFKCCTVTSYTTFSVDTGAQISMVRKEDKFTTFVQIINSNRCHRASSRTVFLNLF